MLTIVRTFAVLAVLSCVACAGSTSMSDAAGGGAGGGTAAGDAGGGAGGGGGGDAGVIGGGVCSRRSRAESDGGLRCTLTEVASVAGDAGTPNGFAVSMTVAVDESGCGVVAWTGAAGLEAAFVAPSGEVTPSEVVISYDDGGNGGPVGPAAGASSGNFVVATSSSSHLIRLSRATPAGWTTLPVFNTSPYSPGWLRVALAPDAGTTLSWSLSSGLATANQPWLAREDGGVWVATPLTSDFSAWGFATDRNAAGDFAGCYGLGWLPAEAAWFQQPRGGGERAGVVPRDSASMVCGVGADGSLAVALGLYAGPSGRFVVDATGDAGAVEMLGSLNPLAIRRAAGHTLLVDFSADALTLLTSDAGVNLELPPEPTDAGATAPRVLPFIDEDGNVFTVFVTQAHERPFVSVHRPPSWDGGAPFDPFGPRAGPEPMAPVVADWNGGHGVIAWREGKRIYVGSCR